MTQASARLGNTTWALVPIKPPDRAKTRLSPALAPAEREALARHMARDVLATLRAARGVAAIAVLAAAGSAEMLAAEFGCRLLAEDPDLDVNANLDGAMALLAAAGAGTVVIVPADLPGLRSADVDALLDAHREGVTLVAAARDGGTNALAMTPPGAIGCQFGPDSARRHLEAAGRQANHAASAPITGFARDIDTVDDVHWLCGQGGSSTAQRYLQQHGICARLRQQAG